MSFEPDTDIKLGSRYRNPARPPPGSRQVQEPTLQEPGQAVLTAVYSVQYQHSTVMVMVMAMSRLLSLPADMSIIIHLIIGAVIRLLCIANCRLSPEPPLKPRGMAQSTLPPPKPYGVSVEASQSVSKMGSWAFRGTSFVSKTLRSRLNLYLPLFPRSPAAYGHLLLA